MSSTAYFIQFPHPGQEQAPRDMPWNTQTHRRKFLIGSGRYLEDGDAVADADLVFWGEWEPPSRVITTWPPSGRMPRAIHRPHWIRPARNTARQNTDPWVWGERMLYSNCRQTSGSPIRTPNSMQRLTRGSVICFGSTLDGAFCLDTVFVVGSAEPWDPAHGVAADIDEAFRICTSDPLIARDDESGVALSCATGALFTLYRGATVDDPVEGMFSFVPARPADARDRRFARPAVRLSIDRINPANTQSTLGSKSALRLDEVRDLWDRVRHQVEAEDLLLGVHLRTPPCEGSADVPAADRRRC